MITKASGFPQLTRLTLAVAFALSACAVASASPLGSLQKLFEKWDLFQGVEVSGQNTFTFQQYALDGSATAFQNQRWDTDTFIRTSSLHLQGPIWNNFGFMAELSSSGYGPAYTRWVAGYVGQSTALYYGDLSIDLSGNEFANYSKAVKGWQLDQKVGRGLARFFHSAERSITRYQTFPGNNTTGPFFLTYTPVMEGTEVVKVNEQLQRFGQDYRLDYETGQLWFEVDGQPSKIIPDTATVSVSYQSSGYQSSGGTVYGARAEVPLLGDRMQIGATFLQQQRGASGGTARDTVGYQEDIFNGSGSTGPFDVNYRPIIANGAQVVYKGQSQVIQQALTVLVDNVEQAEGVDYDSYRQIGRIIFRRSVPPTALVIIRYFYDLSLGVSSGDQSVAGVDLVYRINPRLNLQAEWGRSDGGTADTTGDALRTNLSYNAPGLRAVAEYRDTSPSFSFLDSVGFYRHDRGLDLMANWKLGEHISMSARHSDLQTSEGYSFGYSPYSGGYGFNTAAAAVGTNQTTTDSGLDISSLRDDLELRLDYPGWPSLSIMRHDMSNSGSTNGTSDYSSMNYQLTYSPAERPFSFSAGLYTTDQGYTEAGTDTAATTQKGSSTTQLQWSASFKPGSRLSLSVSQGQNTSEAADSTDKSSSSTSQISFRWAPWDKLELNWDRNRTSSVGNVSSGFYNSGYSSYSGYSGLGLAALYPAGIAGGDDDSDTTSRYDDQSSRLSVEFRPSQTLNLQYQLATRTYTSGGSVGYLADSEQSTQAVAATWQLNPQMSFSATFGNDRMKFLEEGRGEVANRTVTVGAGYRPTDSPWNLQLNYMMQSGTSPTYTGFGSNQKMRIVDNDMSDLRGQLSYSLSEDSEVVLTGDLSRYAGGYANFNKQQVEVGYRRRLSRIANLDFSYRFIRNISTGLDDPRYGNTSLTPANQNYIANTFLVTLATQFASSVSGTGPSGGGYGTGSLRNFEGYRAGPDIFGSNSNQYGTGYGSFESLRAYNNPSGSYGGSYQTPFGNSGFGQTGSYGTNYNSSYGYNSFGGNFGGFSQGLGKFSGVSGQSGSGLSGMFTNPQTDYGQTPPLTGGQGRPGGTGDLEDWQMLDDLGSLWW